MNHHRSITLAHPRREPQPQPQPPPPQQHQQRQSWLARLRSTMYIVLLLQALAALLAELAHPRALLISTGGAEARAGTTLVPVPVPAYYCYPLAGCGALACGAITAFKLNRVSQEAKIHLPRSLVTLCGLCLGYAYSASIPLSGTADDLAARAEHLEHETASTRRTSDV
ncbi:hypothetical protein F4775DRAFT_597197 [Biscogniauxia sp. FL1348]|nr:hypothetical protein F4775DRAFT_597197 [Biscogniauxia sp. FL1348]